MMLQYMADKHQTEGNIVWGEKLLVWIGQTIG